jgi:GLPGLI family protein
MRVKAFIIIVLIFTSLNSCKKIQHKDRIKEGYIEYDIEYLDDSLDSFMKGLLPRKMTIKFKNNNTINKIEGFSGIVSFTHIQNFREKRNITLVKILNKKYKYIEKINDNSLFFEDLPGMKIELQDTTKIICGFKSQKAKIIIPDSNVEPFFIYYTDDIIINNVNAQTPFRSIKGVLLEFQVKLYDMPMKLTATKIQEAEISSDYFKIPKGYDSINKKTMVEIIELLKQ